MIAFAEIAFVAIAFVAIASAETAFAAIASAETVFAAIASAETVFAAIASAEKQAPYRKQDFQKHHALPPAESSEHKKASQYYGHTSTVHKLDFHLHHALPEFDFHSAERVAAAQAVVLDNALALAVPFLQQNRHRLWNSLSVLILKKIPAVWIAADNYI